MNGFKLWAFRDRSDFLDLIADKNTILVAMNAEKIIKADQRLKKIVNSNIGYTDGIGAVMALKRKGVNAVKIPGVEFWLDIARRYQNKKSFYLIGSRQTVIEQTVDRLTREFPNMQIAGYRNGFIKESEMDELKKKLFETKPDIVFVAMGSPRQEFLMDELINFHPALYMGLGGSFDIYSGDKKRAPKIFIRAGLEWLYRLLIEPVRIRRQIIFIKFLAMLKLGKL